LVRPSAASKDESELCREDLGQRVAAIDKAAQGLLDFVDNGALGGLRRLDHRGAIFADHARRREGNPPGRWQHMPEKGKWWVVNRRERLSDIERPQLSNKVVSNTCVTTPIRDSSNYQHSSTLANPFSRSESETKNYKNFRLQAVHKNESSRFIFFFLSSI
jgi:hypothetical protein